MKNPLAIMAAIAAGLTGIFKLPHLAPLTPGKHKVGHNEGIAKGASYNKSVLRCQARSRKPDWGKAT